MFAYCRNNPVKRKDASGTDDICVTTNEDDDSPLNDIGTIFRPGGAGGGGGNSSGGGSGTTTLYRSVGKKEAADLAKTGQFRTTDRSMACKQFGYEYDEVVQFGEKVGNDHVVSVTIPTDSTSMFYAQTVDTTIFKHGTLTVYEELLAIFNELIKGTILFLK